MEIYLESCEISLSTRIRDNSGEYREDDLVGYEIPDERNEGHVVYYLGSFIDIRWYDLAW